MCHRTSSVDLAQGQLEVYDLTSMFTPLTLNTLLTLFSFSSHTMDVFSVFSV